MTQAYAPGSAQAEADALFRSTSAMSVAQRKAFQTKIGVAPDGIIGSGSRAKILSYVQQQRREAAERTKQAAAAEKRAEAATRKANAEAKLAEAKARQAAAQEAREKRLADKQAAEFAGNVRGLALAGGIVSTAATMAIIERRISTSASARNAALVDPANRLQKLLPKAKVTTASGRRTLGKVAEILSANRQLLSNSRGVAGFGMAAVFATGGAVSFAASEAADDGSFSQVILQGSALGNAVTAVTVAGTEAVRRSQPTQLIAGATRTAFAEADAVVRAAGSNVEAVVKDTSRFAQSTRGRGATGESISELRTQAKDLGIKNASRMRKAELQSVIAQAQKASNQSLLGGFLRGAGRVVGTVARFIAPVGLAGTAIAASSTSAQGKSLTQQVLEGPDLESDVAYQAADFLSLGAVSATKATVEKLASPSVGAKPLVGGGRPGAGNARLDRERQEFLAKQAEANDQLSSFVNNAAVEVQQTQTAQSPEPWAPNSDKYQRKMDGMAAVADRSKVAALIDTPQPTELAVQEPYKAIAAQYAADVKLRMPPLSQPAAIEQAQRTVTTTSGGKALRGWANPAVQKAAQAARRRKARGGF